MDEKILSYAGFWKRFAAAVIDGLITNISGFIVGFIFGFSYGFSLNTDKGLEVFGAILGILITWVYYAAMESSAKQATIGKIALGIIVTDLNGNRISFARATGRHFAKLLSAITIGIGFLMAGFTKKKQALHDIVAECLIINK